MARRKPQPLNVRMVTVTPTEARKILRDCNRKNRQVRPSAVNAVAASVSVYGWQPVDTIKFAGVVGRSLLLDGQHRLIYISQCPPGDYQILVAEHVVEGMFDVIDGHSKRTAADWLTIEDSKIVYAYDQAATASLFIRIEQWGAAGLRSNHRCATDSIVANYRARGDRDRWFPVAGRLQKRHGGGKSAYVVALCEIARVDGTDVAAEFASSLLVTADERPEHSPITALAMTLERIVRRSPTGSRRMTPYEHLGNVFKAYADWHAGVPRDVLTFRAGGDSPEPFPWNFDQPGRDERAA